MDKFEVEEGGMTSIEGYPKAERALYATHGQPPPAATFLICFAIKV